MIATVNAPPEQRPPRSEHVRADYTQMAEDYDRRRFSGRNGEFLARADEAIVRDLVEQSGASLLVDVPVGTARVASYLRGLDVKLVGCDLTWAMLQCAASRKEVLQMDLVQADAAALPLANESVDCVISLRFFHLIPYDRRMPFTAEFARVLKPGGHVICSFTNGWYAGGLNWFRKMTGRNTLTFMQRNEVRRLFPGFKVSAIRGNFLPLQYLTSHLGHGAERFGLRLNGRFPLNRLCYERFYLLQKGV